MTAVPMESFWMPFSFNRSFKSEPRMLVSASGMNYTDDSGRKVLDSTSGLWCCNAGHCRTEIADAIGRAAKTLDFAPTFHMGHPAVFQLAEKLATNFFPKGLSSIFFTNSGSEAADSALKIALAYHKVRAKAAKPGSSAASAAITARIWPGFRSAESPKTALGSTTCFRKSITLRTRTICRATRFRAARRNTAESNARIIFCA